ncbi:glutathione S-transferase family protein [Sphingopyxis sp. MWB1]|uniref:glutathione S-transferase family protein n=1 Tax=Sphingopyxis sp. MWB1 TaxID=1537715 RepID=UPI001F393198|nr:glutathione S-transferase family protein [Sphingopyxis sp. MWB1]
MISVFERSPDQGRGLARDMPVRWALEEVGRPYTTRPLSFAAMKADAHRARHPFGQIPTFEEGGLVLFESGAILLHIASHYPGLLPAEPHVRARAIGWLFAALSTIEPPILDRERAHYLEKDEPWYAQRMPLLDQAIRSRLTDLSRRLGKADWLDGDFSVGDLAMVSVLRRIEGAGLYELFDNITAYVARATARPAFTRAFEAQKTAFASYEKES